MSKITQANIVQLLDRYVELQRVNARFDFFVQIGQPHDIAEGFHAWMQLKALEAELLDAGIFRWSAGEIVEWARRPEQDACSAEAQQVLAKARLHAASDRPAQRDSEGLDGIPNSPDSKDNP